MDNDWKKLWHKFKATTWIPQRAAHLRNEDNMSASTGADLHWATMEWLDLLRESTKPREELAKQAQELDMGY